MIINYKRGSSQKKNFFFLSHISFSNMLMLDECICNIFFFLDESLLYKCLFVNRHWCVLAVPILWRNPFGYYVYKRKLINTLLTCLNEEEISLLIPFAIKFPNIDHSPLFEYGKFIRRIHQEDIRNEIICWLGISSVKNAFEDYRVQKLIAVVYNMIMRQGSNLQEFG